MCDRFKFSYALLQSRIFTSQKRQSLRPKTQSSQKTLHAQMIYHFLVTQVLHNFVFLRLRYLRMVRCTQNNGKILR